MHHNDTKGNPFIMLWSFGCTVDYHLKPGKSSLPNLVSKDGITTSQFSFPLESNDFLLFDGVKVKHGYTWHPKKQYASPFFSVNNDIVNYPFRLAVTLFHTEHFYNEVPEYFYHGKPQDKPKKSDITFFT